MEDDKEEKACLITMQSARLSRAEDNRRSRRIKVRFSRPWRGCNYAQESDSLLFRHFRKHVVTFLPGLRFLPRGERLTDFERAEQRWDRVEIEYLNKFLKR